MKSYISNSGKTIIISEMADNYLVNSYLYCKKRIAMIKKKVEGSSPALSRYLSTLEERAECLAKEISKRDLAIKPT